MLSDLGKMSQLPKFNSKGVGCQLLMEVMGREREREKEREREREKESYYEKRKREKMGEN